jgi:hypothetical protein
LDVYLDIGYTDIIGFWRLSLGEIAALIDAASRRLKREQKQREADLKQNIIMQRNQALMIGEVVGNIFSKQKHPLTPLKEFYPGLFTEEETEREMDLESYTLLWEDYAYRYNERMKKKRGGGAGEPERHHSEETASSPDGQHCAAPTGDEPGTGGNGQGNDPDPERPEQG